MLNTTASSSSSSTALVSRHISQSSFAAIFLGFFSTFPATPAGTDDDLSRLVAWAKEKAGDEWDDGDTGDGEHDVGGDAMVDVDGAGMAVNAGVSEEVTDSQRGAVQRSRRSEQQRQTGHGRDRRKKAAGSGARKRRSPPTEEEGGEKEEEVGQRGEREDRQQGVSKNKNKKTPVPKKAKSSSTAKTVSTRKSVPSTTASNGNPGGNGTDGISSKKPSSKSGSATEAKMKPSKSQNRREKASAPQRTRVGTTSTISPKQPATSTIQPAVKKPLPPPPPAPPAAAPISKSSRAKANLRRRSRPQPSQSSSSSSSQLPYEVTPLEPGEIAFYHNAFPALREARHELWKVGKLRHQNGGRGNGSNGRRFTGIGGLDLEQLMLACAKVNNGRGTGAVVEEKLKHKVLLARNLRRGIETRARLKMKG